MTNDATRQILCALLEEKGITLPEKSDLRNLLHAVLSPEAYGDMPDATGRALAETFDAIAAAAEPSPGGNAEQP